MAKEFDIEKCTKYEVAIMPEEANMCNDWLEEGEGEAWINPIDPALKGDCQWDGPMSEAFEDFLSEHGFGQLAEGDYCYDLATFDEAQFVEDAKNAGFEVTIVQVDVANDDADYEED